MKKFALLCFVAVFILLTCSSVVLAADDVTSADVALAIQQGEWWLYGQQIPAIYGVGGEYLSGGNVGSDAYAFASTCFAVSAWLENGVSATDQHVIDGMNYILANMDIQVTPTQHHLAYHSGVTLMALSLYGQASDSEETNFPGYAAKVRGVYDLVLGYQSSDANGVTSADVATYGSWGYNTSNTGSWGDLSNTQYAALGVWYASRYFDESVSDKPWASAMLTYVNRCHGWDATNDQPWADGLDSTITDGAFSYISTGKSFYPSGTQTGGGLWCLAMIGEDQNPMVPVAIDWFRNHYTWDINLATSGQYYALFGMAKALTAMLPPDEVISGDKSWTQDLANQMIAEKHVVSGLVESGDEWVAGDVAYWWSGCGFDGNQIIATSWVMMSLAFADTSTESNEKHLAQPDDMTNPIQGKVTIRTTGGVTISSATRENVSSDVAEFPIGAFSFILYNVPEGGTVVVRFEPPAEGFNPDNLSGFVDVNGAPKVTLCWMGLQGIDWSMLQGVTVNVDTDGQFIEISLTDNGAGDSDSIPGQITVTSSALALYESEGGNSSYGSGGCQVTSLSPLMMMLLPLAWLVKR